MTDPIINFCGHYSWLSNFHLCEIHHEGLIYPSTEHAYQAAKTADPEARKLFTDPALTCAASKKLIRTLTCDPGWELVKDKVMRAVCFNKFARHLDLRAKLSATGDAQLVEGNTWNDTYWGICKGVGQNRLGITLMDIRAFFLARESNERAALENQ